MKQLTNSPAVYSKPNANQTLNVELALQPFEPVKDSDSWELCDYCKAFGYCRVADAMYELTSSDADKLAHQRQVEALAVAQMKDIDYYVPLKAKLPDAYKNIEHLLQQVLDTYHQQNFLDAIALAKPLIDDGYNNGILFIVCAAAHYKLSQFEESYYCLHKLRHSYQNFISNEDIQVLENACVALSELENNLCSHGTN